jgi:hypothetical protein
VAQVVTLLYAKTNRKEQENGKKTKKESWSSNKLPPLLAAGVVYLRENKPILKKSDFENFPKTNFGE